jgi:pyridinium-3,5-bisthiocarboxylic acid mononucleotide nickel chelatase
MKKGRPAQTLHVLCHETDEKVARDLLELIFRHTTTLGVRMNSTLHRAKLVRRLTQVESTNGYGTKDTVRVKISSFKTGEVVSIKPEFDDCKEISVSTGVPLESISRDVTIKILEIISSRAKNQPNK